MAIRFCLPSVCLQGSEAEKDEAKKLSKLKLINNQIIKVSLRQVLTDCQLLTKKLDEYSRGQPIHKRHPD